MKKKTRDNGSTYWVSKVESLTDVIRDLHGGIFPTDGIYAFVADIRQEATEYGTYDDARDSEGNLYPIYTNEIRKDYAEISAILSATFEYYQDYFFVDNKNLAPDECEKAHLYAYISWAKDMVHSYLDNQGFWNDENAEELKEEA